jgi:hypothetical protein
VPRRVRGRGLLAFFLPCVVSCTVVLPYAEWAPERGPDLCSNGIDDDFDDALDCETPECARFCPPPVRAPDPPVLSCREPWLSEPLAGREGLMHCLVPDSFPDRTAACRPVPEPFPCEPPYCAYVRAGVTGGTGTAADPVGTVAEAMEIAPTVRVQPGVYHEAVVAPHDAILEACGATIEDDGDPSTPLIDARAGHLELHGLSLHLDARAEGAIAPAIRIGVGARVTANHVEIDGPSRIVLEDDAVFAASSSTLRLDVGATTCPGELDVCPEIECGAAYECRPSLETCVSACPAGCPSGTTCDHLAGECRDLPDLCGACAEPTVCRADGDSFRCVPRACEHAIALGRGAALSLVDSRVRSDARVLLAGSTEDQGGPGRIVFDHTLLELASGALGTLTGLRCSLEVTDSVVRTRGPRTGPWLHLFDSARAVIQGTELDVSDGWVLQASGNADAPEPWTSGVLLTDVLIHGWDPSRPARGVTSAVTLSGATLSAERVAVLGSPGSAFVVGTSFSGGVDAATGRITLRDVLVSDAGGALLAASIPAVAVFGGSCLQASGLRIEGASGGGLVVASPCEHDIEDVAVVAGRARDCAERCDQAGVGIVLSAGTEGTMRRFEVERVNGCALSRSVLARMSLSGGLLRRSSVGLCLQDTIPEPSYDRHADGVVLRDNETDLVVGAPPSGAAFCLPAVAARCGTPFEPD